jgi:hypothetical protein
MGCLDGQKKTPAVTSLPAFYPAPTMDTATAKAVQDADMAAHMTEAARIARARHELHRRRADTILAQGGDGMVTPAAKAVITKRLNREIAQREGWGNRIPLPPIHMNSGAQGSGKSTFAASSPTSPPISPTG